MNTSIQSHKDLVVWQKSMDLVVVVYELTKKFPKDEQYGLVNQMRRSAVSIPSNIAEGRRRGSKREFGRFLRIAFGSGAELETQLDLSHRLTYSSREQFEDANHQLEEIMKMLNSLLAKVG